MVQSFGLRDHKLGQDVGQEEQERQGEGEDRPGPAPDPPDQDASGRGQQVLRRLRLQG